MTLAVLLLCIWPHVTPADVAMVAMGLIQPEPCKMTMPVEVASYDECLKMLPAAIRRLKEQYRPQAVTGGCAR